MRQGDVVRQKWQADAPNRLVLGTSPFPEVIAVYDEEEQAPRLVHSWSHELVEEATPASVAAARRLLRQDSLRLVRWMFGTQVG